MAAAGAGPAGLSGHLLEVRPRATFWEVNWQLLGIPRLEAYSTEKFPLSCTVFPIQIFTAALSVNSEKWIQLDNLCRDPFGGITAQTMGHCEAVKTRMGTHACGYRHMTSKAYY